MDVGASNPYRLDDAAELQRADRCAGQQWCEDEMIARTDGGNIETISVNFFQEAERREPASKNDNFWFL